MRLSLKVVVVSHAGVRLDWIGLDWIGYLRIEGARDSRSRVGSLRRENIKESMSVCVRSGEREEVRVIES